MITDPVVGKDFFGRTKLLDLLNKRAKFIKDGYRQNIAIIGEQFLGKTSLLHQFILSLDEDSIIPVYIEVRLEPFYNFANRFINTFLFHFLKTEREDVPHDMDGLINTCKEYIPNTVKTVKRIQSLLSKKELKEVYNLILDLPSITRQDTDKNFIIILDEFQNLSKFRIKDVFRILGKKIMIQHRIMYIVASSHYMMAENILKKKLSLLFGQFQTVKIKCFSDTTAKDYLKKRLFPILMTDKYKQFIVNLTSGHPFYLNIIASNLKQTGEFEKSNRISLDQLAESLNLSIFDSKSILTQHFSDQLNRLPLDKESIYILILLAIANHKNKSSSIKSFIGSSYYVKDIEKPLKDLVKLKFLQKCGRFYKFNDSLFKIWLKYVYQAKYASIHIDISKRVEYFKQQIKQYFLEFLSQQEKSITSRIIDLYESFHNDIVPVLNKRRRLPIFDKVYEDKIGEFGPYILAYTKGKVWVTAVEENFVTQDHMQDFLQACKRSRRNIYRKIFIFINGMHVNAKILAKEKNVWLWDLNTLNHLIQLYGKEKVIR